MTAFSPLRNAAFRALWLAGIVSNIGAWMQTVGAQWLLVEQDSPTWLVALVQTAASVPVLLLAIPAGVLGEFVNKRILLMVVQTGQLVVVALLTVLTVLDAASPAVLLGLTVVLGVGSALQLPAYQAIVPEIVPTKDISDAASLSSIGVNVARALGPAAAGLVVAQFGVAAVFALNAASFAVFVLTLLFWRTYKPVRARPETFAEATVAGVRYVINSPVIRGMYLRLALFLLPANGIWALLPLVAHDGLNLGSAGYGILLAALGAGSIAGAFALPAARRVLGTSRLVTISVVVFGAASILLPWAPALWSASLVLLLAGAAWLGVIATINGSVQSFLPPWVRTRGLSMYQLVLYGGTALGSVLVGAAAQAFGLTATLVVCGVLIVAVAGSLLVRPLPSTAGIGREIVPLPLTDLPTVPAEKVDDADEVLVLVRYTVPEADRPRFREQMVLVEQSRKRTGARRWQLYDDHEDAAVLVEAFTVGSWQEHLNQHADRLTEYDSAQLEAARRFSTVEPAVDHLIAVPPAPHERGAAASSRGAKSRG